MKRQKKNAPKTRSIRLHNFTGTVRRNPDGTVSIAGIGKRAKHNPSKRKVRRRVGKALTKYVRQNTKNVAAGFYDEDGIFHPIRASYDYNRKRAGEGGTSAAELAKYARRKRRK